MRFLLEPVFGGPVPAPRAEASESPCDWDLEELGSEGLHGEDKIGRQLSGRGAPFSGAGGEERGEVVGEERGGERTVEVGLKTDFGVVPYRLPRALHGQGDAGVYVPLGRESRESGLVCTNNGGRTPKFRGDPSVLPGQARHRKLAFSEND